MPPRKAKAGPAEQLVGFAILALLGAITVWLLVQQSSFNAAVLVAARGGQPQGRLPAVAGQALSATAKFFPEVAGFTPLAAIESYNPANLSDKIDGKAELYLSAGFQEMSCRAYRLPEAGQAHVEVFVYHMGSPQNAYAVFSLQRRPGAPDSPLTAHAYATANALFFTQGRFYVEIVSDRASPEVQRFLEAYAGALLARIPGEADPKDQGGLLPKEGLIPDSVRLSPTDTFGLADFSNVVTGEYTLKTGKATAFVAARDTPAQAQAEARRYREFLLANGYRRIQTAGAPPFEALAMDDSFEIILVQGRILAGVHDASSVEAALELADALLKTLKEKP